MDSLERLSMLILAISIVFGLHKYLSENNPAEIQGTIIIDGNGSGILNLNTDNDTPTCPVYNSYFSPDDLLPWQFEGKFYKACDFFGKRI